jgi:transposase-like protein
MERPEKFYADLNAVYSAATEEADCDTLEEFGNIWDTKYPMIYQSWDTYRDDLSEIFKDPSEIRKVIYTTNLIESLNYQLRKATKIARHFPTMMLYSRYCIWQFGIR